MNKIVFIGNFVNDVILIHQDLVVDKEMSFQDIVSLEKQMAYGNGTLQSNATTAERITVAKALGGSVTYGSLAATNFGSSKSYIVTSMGNDIIPEFKQLIERQSPNSIDLTYSSTDQNCKNTSYYLNYYNNKKNRNLSLMEKGKNIDPIKSCEAINEVRPDAILFVPVSDELDEELVIKVAQKIRDISTQSPGYCPVLAFDIQGFLRTFQGSKVTTRPKHIMIQKLISISQAFSGLNIITVVKAEYGEAAAIMGDHDPATCARLIRENFGFSIVSITMGGDGGFISSTLTGEIYIPTFKPTQVTDETGCGDTFLTCTVLELLNTLKTKLLPNHFIDGACENTQNTRDILKERHFKADELLYCVQVGSAGASFLVEQLGPNGFANRDSILDRVKNGTKQLKQHYLQYNSPKNDEISYSTADQSANSTKQKVFKSTTSYK
ncbi:hypothetical protein DLAC_08515 [Tieghemostelium lacteum]|uniref:Carbohydrate kinase PfkB domain-containing protein n=1 Tax=Tieghemostelium lacteum TaxID=361077 RepID=A0A151Z7N6_TIELA|nr:hypothetical protein DLAC_08515 [Tieghemostelium lacteum]|eukprot:KYQ89945.1 hypothetical protein DLAC_08515 [Tieghemostelium lacteum]